MANRLQTLNTIPFLDKRNCPPSKGEGKSVVHQHIQRSHVMSHHCTKNRWQRTELWVTLMESRRYASDGLGMLRAPLESVWCGWCFGTTHFCLDAQPAVSSFPIPLWKRHSCFLCQEKSSTRKTSKPANQWEICLFWSVLECLEKKLRKISSVVYGCGGAGPQPKEAGPLPRRSPAETPPG